MYDSPVPVIPTHERCFLRDTQDALLVLQAVLNDRLPLTQRRPNDQNRPDLIKSGNVFVVDIAKGPINRWTDGLSWSPSRILGAFLLYREKKQGKRLVRSGHVSKKSKSGLSPMSPTPKRHSKKLNSSNSFEIMNPNLMSQNEMAYPDFLLDSDSRGIRGAPPPPPPPPFLPDLGSTHMRGQSVEYNLYGSLTSNEQYKEDGLLKKTITIGFRESVYRIVGYYLPREVEEKKLLTPTQDETFADIHIDPELSDSKNIRMPISMNERDYDPIDPIYGTPITVNHHHPLGSSYYSQSMGNMDHSSAMQYDVSKQLGRTMNITYPEDTYMNNISSRSFIDMGAYGNPSHRPDSMNEDAQLGQQQYRTSYSNNPQQEPDFIPVRRQQQQLQGHQINSESVRSIYGRQPSQASASAWTNRREEEGGGNRGGASAGNEILRYNNGESCQPVLSPEFRKTYSQSFQQGLPVDYRLIPGQLPLRVDAQLHFDEANKLDANQMEEKSNSDFQSNEPNHFLGASSSNEPPADRENGDSNSGIFAPIVGRGINPLDNSANQASGFPASVIARDSETYESVYPTSSPRNSLISEASAEASKDEFAYHEPQSSQSNQGSTSRRHSYMSASAGSLYSEHQY